MVSDTGISAHYSQEGMLDRILRHLSDQGKDIEHLALEDLAGADNFHTRGLHATIELLNGVAYEPGSHILDVGSGLGGPARFLASRGFAVTGVDLTPAFCQAAEDLTRRVGLAGRVRFVCASVLEMPCPDCTYGGVWLQHVGMNIADKAALFSELFRVLEPGGKVALHEVCAGPGGDCLLPAPWATDSSDSHLVSQSDYRSTVEAAGFLVEHWLDDTPESVRAMAKVAGSSPALLTPLVLFGEGNRVRFQNYSESLASGRCTVFQAVLAKPKS